MNQNSDSERQVRRATGKRNGELQQPYTENDGRTIGDVQENSALLMGSAQQHALSRFSCGAPKATRAVLRVRL
jgi:hypothetical protein